MTKRFVKIDEDFVCDQCNATVIGNGYTNHCPQCLFSKHVDNFPGDRLATCRALMEPVAIENENGQVRIIHRCLLCGHQKPNRVSEEDSRDALLALSQKIADLYARNGRKVTE